MGRPVPDDEEELLELPAELDPEDEVPGLPEAEELALADIHDGPEDVGLDTELGMTDPFEPSVDDDDEPSTLDEENHGEIVAEVDAEGEEGGWLEDSEGTAGSWEFEIDAGEDEYGEDDGGLEGVDDPMLDGLSDDDASSDDDDDRTDDDLGEELLREIEREGALSDRG